MSWLSNLLTFGAKAPIQVAKYSLVERATESGDAIQGVRIDSGPLSGMVFSVPTNVVFNEGSGGKITLKFTYDVHRVPTDRSLHPNDPIVETIIGDIIVDIIARNYSENDNDDRADCITYSNEGPGVC